jgi:hypothetical protein
MRRPVGALLLTTGLAMATVATPSEAQAQWGGWGYAPDVYGYALPSYGYGYGNGPAYGTSYYSSYPPAATGDLHLAALGEWVFDRFGSLWRPDLIRQLRSRFQCSHDELHDLSQLARIREPRLIARDIEVAVDRHAIDSVFDRESPKRYGFRFVLVWMKSGHC